MKISTRNHIFLLGGHDLEMLEIKKLLISLDVTIIDKELAWGAKWADYSENIKMPEYNNKTFVGVELAGKTEKPAGAIDIDHHSLDSEKPSSIEQVAQLFDIKLNRWQELVAANDQAYIPGMAELCATQKEIEKIRKADKKAQGVTEEDEKKALESVDKYNEQIQDIIIIKSLTDKFSPITDLMYGETKKLIVYNNKALSYYGTITKELREEYNNEIKSGKIYYRGKETSGFLGFVAASWTEEEIFEQKDKLIEMVKTQNPQKLYSHHIFLFPFRWKVWDTKEDDSLEKRFAVKKFTDYITGNNWNRKPFELKDYSQYNEYNYFYEHVRNILYDLGEDLKTHTTKNNDELINHLEYKLPENDISYYNIKLKEDGTIFQLEIDSILLNIYRTGTAVLSFHLRNHKHSDEKDILKINKFGRRLFVPFFDLNPESIYTGKNEDENENKLLCSTKNYEIPDAIWIGNELEPKKDAKEYKLYEDFEQYRIKDTFKNGPFVLPKFIEGLFPENFFLVHERQELTKSKKEKIFKIYLRPVLDDRMYVVSWYGNSELAKKMAEISECPDFNCEDGKVSDNREKLNNYSFEENDWWYSYVFADTSPMHTDKFERKKLLKKQSYSRWVENYTLYGFSRYSFVMLTSSFSDLENFRVSYLVRHLQSMYYKMAELSLLQRATVLSYSDEVTRVSDIIDQEKGTEKVLKRIKSLYEHYILFVNKIYFREITAQEQGIEMYDLMQQSMRTPQEVKDLDSEIDELNRFASMIHDKMEQVESKAITKQAQNLTKIATIFLIPTLIAGLLGMNLMPDFESLPTCLISPYPVWPFWISLGLITIITIGGYHVIFKYVLKRNNKKQRKNKRNE